MKSLKVAAAIAGIFVSSAAFSQSLVKIDGSSTVFPITEAVAEEFQKMKKNAVKVTVGISGTGGGFKKFCRGETDISDASRPILKKEMEDCAKAGIKYVELPVAFDALTVVINPKNTWIKQLTVAELKTMWEPGAQGKITRWNQVNPAWPDAPLKLFGPGADSGTFDYFTEAVNHKAKSSRGDFTASEDDNVLVQGVSRDTNALGYFGFAYYDENKGKLKAVPIVNPKGKAVAPSIEAVMAGEYEPLARPIFIYVSAKSMERAEIREFVEFYLKHGGKLAKEVKYVPLGDADYKHALENFSKKKTGTGFGGEAEVGVKVSDLLKRNPKE
ncbi:MAG: PstS family phosphate ABC transporter substrate-binding protein [Sulfuritalea sp.]|jgi:phosphate transport system substrate-binding protein|nr:PstS family phosphate ABC transporter substrate-binding protein [Sulfuritalea sp.]MBP6636620.1 PstS family phosphate ABC transporter substrate-binding protein [Sulfuritalea sp.]MBP7422844.1 PstS family phosphate ABC transporter substrate-binding protein [Sulfuritalea sp.]